MNTLISIASNILYRKENEEYTKFHELIFIADKASYIFSNDGEVVRERELLDYRFTISDKQLDGVITTLKKMKEKK